MQLPSQADIDREQIRRKGLAEFMRRAWHIVEPSTPYVHNWHIDVMAEHIMACVAGETEADRNLICNVPPGACKSLTFSVFLPAWIWTEWPGFCSIYASYDIGISIRDARRCLDIIRSPWYRQRWPNVVLRDSNPSVTEFFNTAGGFRFATSVESVVTGRHAHLRVVDDPIKPLDTMGTSGTTAVQIQKVKDWWDGTMTSRNKDPKTSRYAIIMQRLHEDDLAGYLLKKDAGHCTHLKLPMRYDPEGNTVRSRWGGGDVRREPGELLWSARFDEAAVQKLERDLGVHAPAQLQQEPTNPDGEIFKGSWLRYYDSPLELPRFYSLTLSIDCSFKDAAGSDSVSLQLWGSHQTNEYLVCDWNDRMSFTDTVSAVKRILAGGAPECLVSKYRVGAKLVEDKANGAAVMNVLQKEVPGLIPITPEGGKIARANAVSWLHQAGNVWYPNPKLIGVTWATPHINQIIGFPKARKDDSTDAETQFLTYRHRNGSNLWAAIEAHRQKSRLTTT